jgi:putative oxidoreductase
MPGLYVTDASWLDTVGRLLIVALFVVTGLRNLQKHQVEDHIQRLTIFKAPVPAATFWSGIALEFIGSALVLLDWYPEVGVLCLMVFTVLASALLLRFWEVDDPVKRIGMQNGLFANIAVLGGLVLLLQNVL